MLLTSIITHSLLIAVLFYRRAWQHVPILALIALLGLGGTPLLHYAYHHIPKHEYFYLYYSFDPLMAVLYVCCIWHFYRTSLAAIAYSQAVYLGIKCVEWYFLWRHLSVCRFNVATVMRPINIFTILFWVWVIWRYDGEQRRTTMPNDPDGPVPPPTAPEDAIETLVVVEESDASDNDPDGPPPPPESGN